MTKPLIPALLPILGLCAAAACRGEACLARTPAWSGFPPAWDDTLFFLCASAYVCLLLGLTGLRLTFYLFRKQPPPPLSLSAMVFWAFPLPFLVFVLPAGIIHLPIGWNLSQPAQIFPTLQPWLPALQAISLALLIPQRGAQRQNIRGIFTLDGPALNVGFSETRWPACLAGLGLWLAGTFAFQLVELANPAHSTAPILTSPLRIGLALVVVLVAPLVEGIFFRGWLFTQFQHKWGVPAAIFACAGISAALTLQPSLWIPAFLAALGLNYIALQPGGLRASIFAHMVFNLLALLIIPGLLF